MGRRVLFFVLRYCGLVRLFRFLKQRNKVTILLFHDLHPKVAARAFAYFQLKYSPVSLTDYTRCLGTNPCVPLPRRSLIVTFDDGHIGNYKMASIAQSYEIPITIFLCSSIVGTHRNYWFQVSNLSASMEHYKKLPNHQRLTELAAVGFDQTLEDDDPKALQMSQIKELIDEVDFQAHTKFHPILPSCTDEEAYDEIAGGKQELEELLQGQVQHFAYPNGDYSLRDEQMVKDAGFKSALTVDFGFNDLHSDPYRLKRIPINDTKDINEIVVKASGLWAYFKTRNGSRQRCGLMPVFTAK